MQKTLIMWDWDGTIIDTYASAFQALQDMANKYNLPPVTEDDLKNVMGTYQGAFWAFHFGEAFEEPNAYFLSQFEKYNLAKTPMMFEGVRGALEYVKGLNIPQIVLSNMPQDMLDEESKRADLRGYFFRVCGLGKGSKDRKPYKEKVEKSTDGIEYHQLVMIGDGESDLMTAQNVGAKMIYVSKKERTDFKYDYLAKSHTEILDCLKKILEG